MNKNLWTKDFICITLSTILSAIGGEAINLPISLLVFDKTQSTLLSSIILICGVLPDMILPIIIAPIIDKGTKKKWIVGLDILMAIIYIGMGLWIINHEFKYYLYVFFVLSIGTISVFYKLSYNAWYPDLIPEGFEQKGYAVSGTIYPMVIIVMSPIAAFIYENMNMSMIFFLVCIITIISIIVESQIKEVKIKSNEKYTFDQYKEDIGEGFRFIKNEKGIRNIYSYMSITSGASEGVGIVTQAYYQSNPYFTVTMLGFLKSSEMIGRLISGCFQYNKEIPAERRYLITKYVYAIYDLMDAFLLFMNFPLMIVNRFICGTLGTTSATIRETAVQSYLPSNIRARVNAFFSVIFAIGSIVFQFLAGIMGQVLSYKITALILGLFTFITMIIFIVIPKEVNSIVYKAVRN